MRVLALDSTTRDGSVALLDVDDAGGTRSVDERAGDATRPHAERLPAELLAVLDAHQLTAPALDVLAVASGPGSFTGLRIGIATMQGLALAAGRPLIGVAALDALAESAAAVVDDSALIAAWMDAHRREVFSALYRGERSADAAAARVEVEGPRVGGAADVLARWNSRGLRPSVFVGGGAALYSEVIGAVFPAARVLPGGALAATIARLAARRALRGERPHPAALQPLYVRRPDAELARDAAAHHT